MLFPHKPIEIYSPCLLPCSHLQQNGGIAFLTPSSATGQEEDKQPLALAFTEVMQKARSSLHIVSLPATLSAINREGLSSENKKMFEDYRLTGILARDLISRLP